MLCLLGLLGYPLAYGPATYADVRGWPQPIPQRAFRPAQSAAAGMGLGNAFNRYLRWWAGLAYEHEGVASPF